MTKLKEYRYCEGCGQDYYAEEIYQIFCSDECSHKYSFTSKEIKEIWNDIKNKAKETNKMNSVNKIIAYECGELDDDGVIELFQELVNTGQAWSLQGHYGRTAKALIDAGYVKAKED